LPAKVATTSESITPNSRTLLVELHLDNPENQIQPGSYAQVRLTSGSLGQIVTLPNNTLLFRAQGLQVGVVKPDNSVELRDIKVGRDFGTTIQVVQGVTPSDKVILNPSDSLVTHNYPQWIRTPDLGCLRDSVSSGQKRFFAIVSPPIPTSVAGKTIRRIMIFDNHPDSLRLVLKSGLDLDSDAAASRRERRTSIICGFILIAMVVAALLWPLC
jgi:hypothetical protein